MNQVLETSAEVLFGDHKRLSEDLSLQVMGVHDASIDLSVAERSNQAAENWVDSTQGSFRGVREDAFIARDVSRESLARADAKKREAEADLVRSLEEYQENIDEAAQDYEANADVYHEAAIREARQRLRRKSAVKFSGAVAINVRAEK